MTVVDFVPKVTVGPDHFQCGLCDTTVYRSIAIDHWPVCAMCRWCCNVEDRWGHRHDGIKP